MPQTPEVEVVDPTKSMLSVTMRRAAIAAVAVGIGIIVIAKIATRNVDADNSAAAVEA